MNHKIALAAGCAAMLLASCATTGGPNNNQNARQGAAMGAAAGAIAGAIIGYNQDHSGGALRGAIIGGAGGAAIGGAVGNYMDKQQEEFNRQLAAEQAAHQIEIQRMQNENLKITMNNEVSFDYNSAIVKPAFHTTLDKVSDILARYDRTTVTVVGHTDSDGKEGYNQQLSERRARAVANYMQDRGVATARVRSEGRGELEPRDSNATAAGKQLNRRVEIIITPNQQ